MKRRKVYPGEVHHVCQMTQGKRVVFYTASDYLVFFTVFSTVARRRGIPVLALCPMPDHVHHVSVSASARELSAFVNEYSRIFAHLWNRSRDREGYLFYHSFSSAAKLGSKQVRTTLAYNYNNPVERKLVQQAEQYRWNFLAYARNDHPFSAPVTMSKASRALKKALSEINALFRQGKYLNYAQLARWKRCLKAAEQQQLIDQIVSLWNVVDYDLAIGYYGSLEAMIRAFHDNTGSEYDIREDRDNYSDAVYSQCSSILLQEGLDLFRIPAMSPLAKREWFRILSLRTSARPRQLLKYLHLPLDRGT